MHEAGRHGSGKGSAKADRADTWGLRGSGAFRLGENARGYRKGHGAEATGWFAVKPSDHVSLSVRVLAKRFGNYSGADAAYGNPMMVPTARADLRGGTRVDLPVGSTSTFPADR